jgi:phospholipid/cholesterol/gamma-HCH transport system permease protein
VSAPSGTPMIAAEPAPAAGGLFAVTRTHFPAWAVPAGHLLLLGHCIARFKILFNPMVRLVFLRQVHYVGVDGMRAIAVLALALGALLVTEATSLLGATNSYLYDMLSWALVTEAAPLLVAVVVIGRSATSMATELSLMKVRGEMRYLEQMRIDPRDYVVLPRIAALTASLLAATIYFQAIAIVGGFSACALLLPVSFTDQMGLMLEAISPLKVMLAGAKTLIFGLVVGTIACFAGLYAGHTINDVPRAQLSAYMRSLICVVSIDFTFALATFSFSTD